MAVNLTIVFLFAFLETENEQREGKHQHYVSKLIINMDNSKNDAKFMCNKSFKPFEKEKQFKVHTDSCMFGQQDIRCRLDYKQ